MVLAVIPSRISSSRFPGKALALLDGVPLVVRVVRQVLASKVACRVVLATDDVRIAGAVRGLEVDVVLSQEPFRSGSDRVAAAARGRLADVVLNVQGDEPLVDREVLLAALSALQGNDLGTVAVPLADPAQLADPNTVKVHLAPDGTATAFLRHGAGGGSLVHRGIYSFTQESLARFTLLPSAPGEIAWHLEQLRALEAGMRIGVRVVPAPAASVNCPGDVPRVESLIRAGDCRADSH